jgi:hypothetical protein
MSGYIGTQPVPQATQTRDAFTATAGQTSFATAGYTPSYLDVFLNGVHLQNGTDFTATNGSDVVLTTGAASGDVLEVVAYSTFDIANTYNRTEADAEFVNDPNDVITVSGSSVGVGTNSPAANLQVVGSSNTDVALLGTSGTRLTISPNDSSGEIKFKVEDPSGNNYAKFMTFHTEGGSGTAERMRIDWAGRVTIPNQPLANVMIFDHNTSGVHAGAGVSALDYSQAMSQGGMSVTSDRITVPVAGKYYVSARQLNQSNSGEYFSIVLNGVTLGYGYNSDTAPLHDLNVDMILSMAATDYIQVSYLNATANRFESGHSNLLIYLIG